MRLVRVKVAVVSVWWAFSWAFVALAFDVSAARADGIAPGLWQVITQNQAEGTVSGPHESAKCLTEDETKDLATTFSPVPTMVNSECAPIERKLEGGKLDWHLVCKGQLNVELTGAFNFDSEHHYTATVRTHAEIGGQTMDTLNMIEGRWVSACQ